MALPNLSKNQENTTELQPMSMTFGWLLKDFLASRIVMHNMKNELFTMHSYIINTQNMHQVKTKLNNVLCIYIKIAP